MGNEQAGGHTSAALAKGLQLSDADAVYRAIVDAHRGLSDADSAALNAALVLILANHAGDDRVVREALVLARSTLPPAP